MNFNRLLCLALAAGSTLTSNALAVDNPEVEPNDSKATATLANGSGTGMAAGDTLSGTTTGASITVPGPTSADYFLVNTAPAPLGIYRYRLQLSSDTLFQIGTIRGLTQTAGVINAGTDATLQTASTSTALSLPPRTVQWYGFGRGDQIYYRVAGVATSTSAYTATLSRDGVLPEDVVGTIIPGTITFTTIGQGHSSDTELWLYDSDLNAIAEAGNDDESVLGGGTGLTGQSIMTRVLLPGTYHLAVSTFNFANNQPAAIDDDFRTGGVLDFPDAGTNSSTTQNVNVSFAINHSGGSISVPATRTESFGVQWYRFVVQTPVGPFGSGSATPAIVANDGTGATHLAVTVTPSQTPPPSTNITVVADLSAIGGAASASLFDDGLHNDGAAGDNVFGLDTAVATGTAAGVYSLPFTISDAELRSNGGSISLRVVAPPAIEFDFGDMSVPHCSSQTLDVSAGQVKWFRFSMSAAADAATGTFLDIDTELTAGCQDTEIGVYRADGTLRLTDDDDGSSLLSQISFGAGTRPAVNNCTTAGVAYNGRDGVLPPGVYYLAVTRFNATFGANDFNVTTTGPEGTGLRINICSVPPTTPPVGTGSTNPSPAAELSPVDLRVTVNPGTTPPSTGITVVADASSIGGSSTLALLDDGIGPDVAAGDNVFTARVTTNVIAGPYTVPFTVSDAEARSSNGNIAVTIVAVNGACCTGTTCVVSGQIACANSGGVYQGAGTNCGDGYSFTLGGGSPLEDISGTGTPVTAAPAGPGDDAVFNVTMGFPFTFFGVSHTTVNVCTNGNLQFPPSASTTFTNVAIPNAALPNNMLAVLWDDFNFNVNTNDSLVHEVRGTPGVDLRHIFQWTNVAQFSTPAGTNFNTFQVVLFEDGRVEYRYGAISGSFSIPTDAGGATVGVEDPAGGSASTQYGMGSSPVTSDSNIAVAALNINPCDAADPCDRADFNNDTFLDPDDLSDFITCFFLDVLSPGTCPASDFNQDGFRDPDDLSDFITTFFLCL